MKAEELSKEELRAWEELTEIIRADLRKKHIGEALKPLRFLATS